MTTETGCCIAGCGPAGAVLALLLARAGIDVVVLEKHGDFLRDFRGDTIHPSTLEILDEVGLADRFLELPHRKVRRLQIGPPGGGPPLDFTFERLKTRFPYLVFIPQWDFLDFLTREAARYPGFRLLMNADATGLIVEDGVVRGVRYRHRGGEHELRALLTVGADGRTSATRAAAGLPLVETSPPMDVLWFRLTRRPEEPEAVVARAAPGHFAILIDRGDYWQIADVIPKGAGDRVRAAGLPAFRAEVAALVPDLADRVGELRDWEDVKLLSVRADRLARWYRPGYLAIGDAAHAMSPVAGVGINLAVQDAVVAASALWAPLRRRVVSTRDLAVVQRRREWPTRIVQAAQAAVQRLSFRAIISAERLPAPPRFLYVLPRVPLLRDVPARLVGFGVGRPRVESPALATPAVADRGA
jgi:2-polyprenyl-6-methoxyphenol hydroxylase-like FAD-dependent oxidoreductase